MLLQNKNSPFDKSHRGKPRLLMDKRGDERLLGFYWIIIFIIITVGIVSATVLFFSKPLDVRSIEARVLSDKLVDCVSEQGELVKASFSDIEKECGLDFGEELEEFYIRIIIQGVEFEKGNKDLSAFCGAKDAESIPVCYEGKLFVLDDDDEFVLVDLLTVVNKVEQNVK